MKYLLLILLFVVSTFQVRAQDGDCIFKKPILTIHFGSGNVRELNSEMPYNYSRVSSSCPTDGHFTYTNYTSDCFSSDWLTLTEDHTPGDGEGNFMLVNASPSSGTFLTTNINSLKPGTIYEFSVWMMNVCKISDKCPFPLLPNITIRLQNPAGKIVAQFGLGELVRREAAIWTQYRSLFTTPPAETELMLVMIDNAPGGCGNDFALDDISFRECEKIKPVVIKTTKPPVVAKAPPKPKPPVKQPTVAKQTPLVKEAPKPVVKKDVPVKRPLQTTQVGKSQTDSASSKLPVAKPGRLNFPAPPAVLITRANPVIRKIETEAAEIQLDLYDNGQIDDDTVTIYHNNKLLISHARLSQKPISFHIAVNAENPHHELIMVAENLGSIPPNTSLMIVTAGTKRYEVFISSTEQKNAKIIIDLAK